MRWLLLPPGVPQEVAGLLRRLAGALGVSCRAVDLSEAPSEGLLLHWLGGSEGRGLHPPPATARRLVLLGVHRGALRPLALRLRPAALVESFALARWQEGAAVPEGANSGLAGLRQAPLATGATLDAGDYVIFRGEGSSLAVLLDRYLDWFEQAGL